MGENNIPGLMEIFFPKNSALKELTPIYQWSISQNKKKGGEVKVNLNSGSITTISTRTSIHTAVGPG